MRGPGRQFLPGQTGNLSGRPRLPADLKAVQRLSPIEVELTITKMLRWSAVDFRAFLAENVQNDGGRASMLEVMIASILHRGVVKGEPLYLQFVLDRTVGKIKEMAADSSSADEQALLEQVPIEHVVAYLKKVKSPVG